MNIRPLETLAKTTELGKFTKAAETIRLIQPAEKVQTAHPTKSFRTKLADSVGKRVAGTRRKWILTKLPEHFLPSTGEVLCPRRGFAKNHC